jgi:capsular polysaccharide export protein
MRGKSVISTFWSSSYGITSNQQFPLFFLCKSVKRIHPLSKPTADDCVVGWGNKSNTAAAIDFSRKNDLTYVCLEDGFIGYLGHPSTDKNRLSLIKDDVGIYYDARQPSRLERLCLATNYADNFSATENARAQALIQQITAHGISKYNHTRVSLPQWLTDLNTADDGADCILLVDQTAGDQSIVSGLASTESFQQMLQVALAAHPGKPIIIKTHPDVLIAGKSSKLGHFTKNQLRDLVPERLSVEALSRVHLLTDDCSIPEIMAKVSDVYVVTSQLGFEALLYGKQVHCFGMPFYAGWGLTYDQQVCDRRVVELTLPQLVYASLVRYPTYLHPERQVLCEVEEVVDWLVLQLESNPVEVCFAVGFSLWKRAFVKQFVGRLADSVIFVDNEKKLELLLAKVLDTNPNQVRSVLLWGRGRAEWAKSLRHQYRQELLQVWFIEDGFLRSVGLGADLRRPSCLVIDRQGMYYDSSENSDVIDILKAIDLTAAQQARADTLVADIRRLAITKYNVGRPQDSAALMARIKVSAQKADKGSEKGSSDDSEPSEIIIVPGQFENDLSIACSLGEIKTNIALLVQVRADYPTAYIIFKEHPDVYSGVRPGALGESAAKQFANLYLADIDMDSLLACADRVCTLTSLTGFEALLRNKAVTVYGSPFYSGWGLTTDKLVLPGRHRAIGRSLSLSELVYGAMIEYPRYVDWNTGALTGPEQTVDFLAQQRVGSSNKALKSGWLVRQARKLKYFIDTYFF